MSHPSDPSHPSHPSRPRLRAQFVAALLCALLGFAAVVQVRARHEAGPALAGLREADLMGILDDVTERGARLDAEARELDEARARLADDGNGTEVTGPETRERAATLAILAGTVPAHGPGIELVVPDPRARVEAEVLLDALQELRDAGAEAVQIGPVRVGASTAVVDRPAADGRGGAVAVDGVALAPPYRFLVVGEPDTLATALAIPGGVLEQLRQEGSAAHVVRRDDVVVDALRVLEAPEYARPAPAPGP